MSRNPKADVPYVAQTPEAIVQAEYNKMNDDEKKRHNLARSQRVEPTDPISPLVVSGPVLRNGLTKRPPSTMPPPTQQEETLEAVEEAASSSGIVVGVVVGLGLAVGLYLGVTRLFLPRSPPLVSLVPQ